MKRKIITVVVVVAIVAGVYLWNLEVQKNIEEQLNEALSKYNGTVSDITYEEDCTICDRFGCESLGEECWKANVTSQEGIMEVALDANGNTLDESSSGGEGGAGGSGGEEGSGPPPETCQYQYTEQQGSVTTHYTNTGCLNPEPTCRTSNYCGVCASVSDCIGLIETVVEGNATNTVMRITSTQYNGHFNYSTGRCFIDDSVIIIYDNMTTFENCYDIVASHLQCDDGICDFI